MTDNNILILKECWMFLHNRTVISAFRKKVIIRFNCRSVQDAGLLQEDLQQKSNNNQQMWT